MEFFLIQKIGILFNQKKKELFLIQKIGILFNPKKIGILFNIENLDKIFSKYPRFVRNFSTKKRFLKNSEFFTKDVLKRLLRGMETTSVIYQVVFEK